MPVIKLYNQASNLRLTQSTALQQQQQPYPVTPEDGQLSWNM
jgi:hypothetical protein